MQSDRSKRPVWPQCLWLDSDTVLFVDRVDSESQVLVAEERDLASSMTPARRREFAGGRAAARRALKLLQFPKGVCIPMGSAGEPVWPIGVAGSLSHTATHAAALVARSARHASVGIDVDDQRLLGPAAAADLMTSDEVQAVLAAGWTRNADIAQNMAFLAKEAVFKFQYPITRRRDLEFDEIRLRQSDSSGVLRVSCSVADSTLEETISKARVFYTSIQELRLCWVLPETGSTDV
jgi:4'-phosphopantetheinyl transferase EntD